MERIWGYVERITFRNEENGFTVIRLQEPKKSDLTTVVGSFGAIQTGETLACEGVWKSNLQHGIQFEMQHYELQAPKDLAGIQKYLESGLIKGIGPRYAKRIVDRFGLGTLKVIDEEPQKLLEVDGIGKKKLESICSCWEGQKTIRQVMLFLQQFEISPSFAMRIYKTYGTESLQKIQSDPYQMARDVFGVGFKTADTIAQKLGVDPHSQKRIAAGIEHVLYELSNEGHTCFPCDKLIESASQTLQVEPLSIQKALEILLQEKLLVKEEGMIWLKVFYLSERGIVRELFRLLHSPCRLRRVDTQKALAWVQEQLHLQLATNQIVAIEAALSSKVQIITGGPGTGKSTITKAILRITEKLTGHIILAAPTGRAAKRMSEITHCNATTIHSLLEWSFGSGGFKRGKDNPLVCDLLVVDEASMIDTFLFYSLLKAIPSHARLILIGDIDQLPSVGAGSILKDLIASQKIPTSILTEIFRQAKNSKIVANAHRIKQGEFPDLAITKGSDFFFIKKEEPDEVLQTILDLVSDRLPKQYRLDRIDDIQVLVPMKRGPIGAERLNLALQEKLNPSTTPLFQGGRRFHLHDKVMQIKNNYEKEVFNGDVGRIIGIDSIEQEVMISFDGKKVIFGFDELDEVQLAYAVSVHKYQGSECPCVVIPIHTSHFMLLHRNLLYTAVTRGKRLVVLVGTGKALNIAVSNNDVEERFTGLKSFL